MNSLQKGVRMLLRLVAFSMMLISGMLAGLEFLNHRAKGVDISFVKVAVNVIVFIAGIVLFAASSKLAARLTDEEEETDSEDKADE